MKKREVEQLLGDYDADPVAALTVVLRIVLDLPTAGWVELLAAAPIGAERRQRLLGADQASLDQLASELNETRTLEAS